MSGASEWCEFATDAYLHQRHRNWVVAEEFGDVIFSGEVVFVHRARAEHIARTLLSAREVLLLEAALALPASPGVGVTRVPPPQPRPLVIKRSGRARDIWGWLGILAGAGVFVAALAMPLDDPALVMALMLALRGGRRALDTEAATVADSPPNHGRQHHEHRLGGG